MLASSRQLAILEIINRDGGAELRQLAATFGVSPGTIRRDLMVLNASGLVDRVHGGAVPRFVTNPGPSRRPIQPAVSLQRAGRASIAAQAAALVQGASVALPAGPISELLALHLAGVPNLTAVTYSLPVAQAFRTCQRSDQTLVLTGGVFGDRHGLSGPMALQAMQSLHIDTGFIEFDGVDLEGRPANITEGTAELNRVVMAVADRVVCYADHTAWHRIAAHQVMAPGPGMVLLIDPQVPLDVQHALSSAGTKLIVARDNDPSELTTGRRPGPHRPIWRAEREPHLW